MISPESLGQRLVFGFVGMVMTPVDTVMAHHKSNTEYNAVLAELEQARIPTPVPLVHSEKPQDFHHEGGPRDVFTAAAIDPDHPMHSLAAALQNPSDGDPTWKVSFVDAAEAMHVSPVEVADQIASLRRAVEVTEEGIIFVPPAKAA